MPSSNVWILDLNSEFQRLRSQHHPEVTIDVENDEEGVGTHQPSHVAHSEQAAESHSHTMDIRKLKDKLTKNLLQSTNIDKQINQLKEPESTIPPWVELTHEFRTILQRLKESIQLLSNLYAARLANHFDVASEQGQDEQIAACSSSIKSDINNCERLIKLIPRNAGNRTQRTPVDLKVMENAMKAMGMMLSQQSKLFRQVEQGFLAKLKERRQQEIAEDPLSHQSDPKLADSVFDTLAAPDGGELNQSQAQALDLMQQNSDARDQAIIQVAQGINELASLFKELNVLVIEQGSILDRIDYNVDLAVERVQKGNVELVEADKISKKGISTKAIGILIIVCVLLLLIFIIKKSSGG